MTFGVRGHAVLVGALLIVAAPGAGAQTSARVGQYLSENAPSPPLFPLGPEDCRAYSDALTRFQSDVGRMHQTCLDGAASDCPDDSFTGCSCANCAQYHGGVSTSGVNECYAAVRAADERIQRVNQILSSIGVGETTLLTRTIVREGLRTIVGDSALAKDLVAISGVVKSTTQIASAVLDMQRNMKAGDQAAAIANSASITRELALRGFRRDPIALLMTDIALDYSARVSGDALRALERDLQAIASGNRAAVDRFIASRDSPSVDCGVLANEQTSHDLLQRDSTSWLALVKACNSK